MILPFLKKALGQTPYLWQLEMGGEVTIVSKFIYGIAFPTIIIVEAGIPTFSSDMDVQSADIIGFFIRIK